MDESGSPVLLEHLFRRQAGRIVACLAVLLGTGHLQLAEDAVQEAMLGAAQLWPLHGVPASPEAWLFRVAHNHVVSALRRRASFERRSEALIAALEARTAHCGRVPPDELDTEQHLRDDELRMIFMCCHPSLAVEARVALSLKLVAGFSVGEIARIFMTAEETIAQRLVRAKRSIREQALPLCMPPSAELPARLDSVLLVIYLMFSGGYAVRGVEGLAPEQVCPEQVCSEEVCLEALRLGRLVCASSISAPRAEALVALMALQAARLPARVDAAGNLVLLEDQDRGRWDRDLIDLGFRYFDHSIAGEEVSEWHVQAAIAATYARAEKAESIDWPAILEHYDHLLERTGSPVVALNRAVVVSKVHGPDAALRALAPLAKESSLRGYHLLPAVQGRVFAQLGRVHEAAAAYRAALECACAEPERRFLAARLAELGGA
ncbi:MAG TPA: sigma-70 family RNA polymerase sigma factor [Acidobacteriaceae bacterium]